MKEEKLDKDHYLTFSEHGYRIESKKRISLVCYAARKVAIELFRTNAVVWRKL